MERLCIVFDPIYPDEMSFTQYTNSQTVPAEPAVYYEQSPSYEQTFLSS